MNYHQRRPALIQDCPKIIRKSQIRKPTICKKSALLGSNFTPKFFCDNFSNRKKWKWPLSCSKLGEDNSVSWQNLTELHTLHLILLKKFLSDGQNLTGLNTGSKSFFQKLKIGSKIELWKSFRFNHRLHTWRSQFLNQHPHFISAAATII